MADAFDRWARLVHVAAILAACVSLVWVAMQVPAGLLVGLYPIGLALGVTLARALSDLIDHRAARRTAAE